MTPMLFVVYQVNNGYLLEIGGANGGQYVFTSLPRLKKAMKEVLDMNDHAQEETH